LSKNHSIECKDEITTVRFFMEPGLDDMCNAVYDVAENYPNELRLWDLSCGINLSNIEIEQLSKYAKSKFLTPAKIAVVASGDLAFGLARVHDFYREQEIIEQRVFRTEQKARAWLNSYKRPE
jgi:hypothetical protein